MVATPYTPRSSSIIEATTRQHFFYDLVPQTCMMRVPDRCAPPGEHCGRSRTGSRNLQEVGSMEAIFIATGAVAALVLLPLLLRTLLDPRFRFWPPPAPGSWQSMLFWSTFRTLNVATFATAVATAGSWLETADEIRLGAVALLLVSGTLYLYSLVALGKPNTYCERDGLVTRGIYRWTRNPQYVTVIPIYFLLAIAADSLTAALLCAATILVYVLMAMAEEPWLEVAYGASYRNYRRSVPRFFNWPRAMVLGLAVWRRMRRQLARREHSGPQPPMLSSRR
jgi:protein-S-isoprenylcysteine O-methyltransferase Ste14